MGRTKLPRVTASSEAPSEEKLKEAASLLNLPVTSLQHFLSAAAGPSRGATRPAPQHQEPLADEDEVDDTFEEIPSSPSPPSRDSDGSDDVVEWTSSAAEFQRIDDSIPGQYSNLTFFFEDRLPSNQGSHLPNGIADSFVEFGLYPAVPRAWPQSAQHHSGTPQPAAPPPAPQELNARSFQPMSWENLDSVMIDQDPAPHGDESAGWAVVGPRPPAHPRARAPPGAQRAEELQIIPVDPQRQQLVRQARRKPYEDRERQQDAGKTRGLKACVRCRMQKIRCEIDKENPKGICLTCQVLSGQKVHNLPCLRYKLTESTLYRTGKGPGLEFTFRWPVMKLKDIDAWASPEVRTIFVESDVCPVPLQLSVKKFVALPGKDSMHRSWMDHKKGVKKTIPTTPYAIMDMQKAVQDMRVYVSANIFPCMDFLLKGTDKLIQDTYEFARKHMQRTDSEEERKLLGNYFRLWFAVRRTATMEHIVGEEKLDMVPETEDPTCPLFGKIPLPPVMIQQLDMILTLGILRPLQKQVLEDFQKLVLANNPRNWMTVYLITFMSLHSCAFITNENYNNARKHGLLRRYSIPNFIQERHHSANVFLAHYHYRTESANPFVQDWRRRHTTPFAHMSTEEIHFLEHTKLVIKEKEQIFKTNQDNELYEHELYFVAQMFEPNWQPRDTVIDHMEGTVNNVELKKYAK